MKNTNEVLGSVKAAPVAHINPKYKCAECGAEFTPDDVLSRMVADEYIANGVACPPEYEDVCPVCGSDSWECGIECEVCGSFDPEGYRHGDVVLCLACASAEPHTEICSTCHRVVADWLITGKACHICRFEKEINELKKAFANAIKE